MTWNLPNILTLLRLLAAPGLALVFIVLPRPFADWLALMLFASACITDWFDGHLARKWKQQTKIGTMLDPIADKAMVVIAICVLMGFAATGLTGWLVFPAGLILFREVFVSGLREYLGDTAGTLKVTKLAKWKTTAQMVAISVLFLAGIFEHHLGMNAFGMDPGLIDEILRGEVEDVNGVRFYFDGMVWASYGGLALLWIAAVLTLITGGDYLRKALPYLKESS